jgi:hypothetical protein
MTCTKATQSKILSTEGGAGVGTVITLLTGVEPILQAAPNAGGGIHPCALEPRRCPRPIRGGP